MIPLKINRIKSLAFVVVLIYLLTGNLLLQKTFGQDTANPADSTIVEEIVPFDISNLAEEFEKTTIYLNGIEKELKPTETEISLDSLMPIAFDNMKKLYENPKAKNIENLDKRELELLLKEFNHLRNLLEEWRSELKSGNEKMKPLKEELVKQDLRWEKTIQMAREQKLPPESIQRFEELRKGIGHQIDLTRKRNGQLLTKQDMLTGKIIVIHETILEIDNALTFHGSSQLFTLESPPIWKEIFNPSDTISLQSKLKSNWTLQINNYKKFQVYYAYNIKAHLALTIFLIVILVLFKNHIKKWSEEKLDFSLNASLRIIFNPIATGFLLSLLLAGVIYPDATIIVNNMRYLMLIPLMVILPGILPDIRKRFLFVFVILIVLMRITELISELALLTRLIYLTSNIIAIIVVWPVIMPGSNMKQFRSGSWWDFGLFIIKLCTIGFAISIVSNLIGNVFLSIYLTRGGVSAIFWGVLFYVLVVVLESLIALIMQTNLAQSTSLVKQYPDELKKHTSRIIRIFSFVFWLSFVTKNFLIYDLITGWFIDFFTDSYELGTLNISFGSILSFIIAIWISFTMARFIRFILQEEILSHFDMPRGVPGAIGMITRLIIIIFGFIVAFGVAGIDLSKITIIIGALGVGIGFGLQNIFNNLVSGLILAFERPIQVGDVIQIASLDLMGEVKEIGFRASTIRTFDGAEVIVPNGNFVSNEMINWTLSDKRRRQEILVGVEYGSDLKKVLEVLNKTVADHDNVLKNPGPLIIFNGFGDSSLNFRVLFWTHFQVGLTTKSAVGIAIDEALKAAGITIPFPQTDLHVKSIDGDIKKIVTPNKSETKKVRQVKSTPVTKKSTPGKPNGAKK